MKSRYLLILITTVFLACQEEIPYREERFQRIIGFEGSSQVEKIIELSNGDLMLLGKMGVSAHELKSTHVGVEIENVEDQGPFIAITDMNGNVKRLNTYPFENADTHPTIEVINITNKTTFLDILENPSGGYHVLAELSGFDYAFTDPTTGTKTTIESSSTFVLRTPLLFDLDEDLNVKQVKSFNGTPDWDFILRSKPRMKALPDDSFIILFNEKSEFGTFRNVGYSFLHLNHQLETLGWYEDFDSPNRKGAFDFEIQDQWVYAFAQDSGQLWLYRHDIQNDFEQVERKWINHSGEFGDWNHNEHFVKILNNRNILLVYTNPSTIVYGNILDSDFSLFSSFEFPLPESSGSIIRVPRAVNEMSNGDLLLYNIIIPVQSNDPISSQIQRVESSGQSIFNMNVPGSPGDIIELGDGTILFGANTVHNELLQRIHLYKVDEYGQLH
jgi:hypothetical protein